MRCCMSVCFAWGDLINVILRSSSSFMCREQLLYFNTVASLAVAVSCNGSSGWKWRIKEINEE